jgi:hypothetical protein
MKTTAPLLVNADKALQAALPKVAKNIVDFSHRTNRIKPEFIRGAMPGFMLAVHTAYQDHYPLKLSVSGSVIWARKVDSDRNRVCFSFPELILSSGW